MAKINRTDITQKAIKDLRLDAARERVPTEASDKIVLTYPLDSKVTNIIKSVGLTNGTGATVYTTPTSKEFYLTTASLYVNKDSSSESAGSDLTCVVDGATVYLLSIPGYTLTAQDNGLTITYKNPIKLDKGTNIRVTAGSAVANVKVNANVTGYTLD